MKKVPVWGVTTEPVRRLVEQLFADYERDSLLKMPSKDYWHKFFDLSSEFERLRELGAINEELDAEITLHMSAYRHKLPR